MAIFTGTFSAVAISAAQDLFEIVAPANSDVSIRKVMLGQYSDFGDAAAELISITVVRGFTTSGSGGTAVTPANIKGHTGAVASTTVVEANNTTVAQDGTGVTMLADTFNVAAGWYYDPPKDERIVVGAGKRLVVRITAPADALTMNGTIIFEELGVGIQRDVSAD